MENRLYIPDIGAVVRLTEDWTFALYTEYRNSAMAALIFGTALRASSYGGVNGFATMPKGTEFKIDRIYVRKGKGEYSSVTLTLQDTTDSRFITFGPQPKTKGKLPKKTVAKIRFWVKLADLNNANMEVVFDPAMQDGTEE